MLPDFSDQNFWLKAFDESAPFYESYVKHLSKALITSDVRIIDLHREAICYVQDSALAPIVRKLIQIAVEYPDASFVESLAFFLSSSEQSARVASALRSLPSSSTKDRLCAELEKIALSQTKIGDEDIACQIRKFASVCCSSANVKILDPHKRTRP